MVRLILCKTMLTAALMGGCGVFLLPVSMASAQECCNAAPARQAHCERCQQPDRYTGDLFYNYYSKASCGAQAAQLYVSPLPVPPLVGHTYITYQPLMPHEFLYKHHRTYHSFYNGGRGLNRTAISWHGTPLRTFASDLAHALRIPR